MLPIAGTHESLALTHFDTYVQLRLRTGTSERASTFGHKGGGAACAHGASRRRNEHRVTTELIPHTAHWSLSQPQAQHTAGEKDTEGGGGIERMLSRVADSR